MSEQDLVHRLRGFVDFEPMPEGAGQELESGARVVSVGTGEVLATQGSPCEVFPVVLSGRARIFAMDEEGREVTLYRLAPGDGCVLAAACSVSGTVLPGFVAVEEAGDALCIPSQTLSAWVDRHRFWRDYVFSLVARQLGQVVAVTNALAFRRLDARIAGYLLEGAELEGAELEADVLHSTHHAVAMEVGSRREVVSRVLKGFEQAGIVSLERGSIRIRNREALARRAGSGLEIAEGGLPLFGRAGFGD